MKIDALTIDQIEKALGYKLYPFQANYLLYNDTMPNVRRSGRTTAYCIRLSLTGGEPLDLRKPEVFSDGWNLDNHLIYSRHYFKDEFLRIRQALENFGFVVRDVVKG